METKKIIEAEIDSLDLHVMEDDQFVTQKEVNSKEMSRLMKCSEETVDSLLMLISDIKEAMGRDLKDIWERLDRIENQ
ncbi:hypothetical protein KA005_55900 [bacterium]|nr:hypothetical protein [bacterium]